MTSDASVAPAATPATADAPAADAPDATPDAAFDASKPPSLQHLIQHCDKLGQAKASEEARNKELSELVERLKNRLTDINMQHSTKDLEKVVRPWLNEIGIKEEDIQSVLEGAMAAQKRLINAQMLPPDDAPCPPIEKNNVIEVMCSAAAAHGQKVQELESARAELAQLKQTLQDNQSIENVISRGSAMPESVLGKRAEVEPPSAYDGGASSVSSSECWSQLFQTVGRGR
tara:strand:- start:418 stop:1107 length:690 start_codon:yes stop_codon:yes gene_type:complete